MNDVTWAERADAEAVADHVAGFIDGSGPVSIAVPGGRTSIPVFEALAHRPLDWSGVTVTVTDERLVPEDHPASNIGQLRRSLGGTGARLQPLEEGSEPGPFDLAWIGMGVDGHIASIFPKALGALSERREVTRTCPDPLPPEAPFERLTLTLPMLAEAGALILVARGADKKALIDRAIAGADDLPVARLFRRRRGPITIFWSES